MDGFYIILAHLIGDYLLQSDWMAQEKTKRSLPALAHALLYSVPFALLVTANWAALLLVCLSHFAIDRWRLARWVCWAKNFLAPPTTKEFVQDPHGPWHRLLPSGASCTAIDGHGRYTCTDHPELRARRVVHHWWHPWADCAGTGYHKDRLPWLSVWLLIIADNTLHLAFNAAALGLSKAL